MRMQSERGVLQTSRSNTVRIRTLAQLPKHVTAGPHSYCGYPNGETISDVASNAPVAAMAFGGLIFFVGLIGSPTLVIITYEASSRFNCYEIFVIRTLYQCLRYFVGRIVSRVPTCKSLHFIQLVNITCRVCILLSYDVSCYSPQSLPQPSTSTGHALRERDRCVGGYRKNRCLLVLFCFILFVLCIAQFAASTPPNCRPAPWACLRPKPHVAFGRQRLGLVFGAVVIGFGALWTV